MERAFELSTEKTGQSFSQCMGNSFRQTVAGIFSDQRMNETVMLEGHLSSTKSRISQLEGEYLLVAQDTTYYNYSGHHSMEGLGKIQGKVKGIMQHNLLCISDLGVPLGLLGQEYWSRESTKEYEGKESQKWEKGLNIVNDELGNIAKKVVLIQDREADIFSFFQSHREPSVELLVRVHQPRNLEIIESGEIGNLESCNHHLPIIGKKRVSIFRDGKEITLLLRLQSGRVNVLKDKKDLSESKKTQNLSLIIATEIDAFDQSGKSVFNQENHAQWYLLTSLSADNEESISRIVGFYALRWRIERLHYTLKSGGLNVEKLQFDDLQTAINALSFYSVVAWQILAIVYLTRHHKDEAITLCFEQKDVLVLESISNKTLKTVKDGTLALAKLAEFAPSKRQPMPGIKVLAQAIERFYYIKLGFNAKTIIKPLQD